MPASSVAITPFKAGDRVLTAPVARWTRNQNGTRRRELIPAQVGEIVARSWGEAGPGEKDWARPRVARPPADGLGRYLVRLEDGAVVLYHGSELTLEPTP